MHDVNIPLAKAGHGISQRDRLSIEAKRTAFTLVEILIVIGIIAILISIILPAIGRARDLSREVTCVSNQKQIAQAFFVFASENKGRLPGNWWDHQNPDKKKRAWLLNANQPIDQAPQCGTVWKYLKTPEVYRCPKLDHMDVGTGAGSNGRFDYAAFLVFSGARLSDVQGEARFTHPDGRIETGLAVPLICEEEPQGGINGGNNEGGHCSIDRLTHIHRGGGYYISTDGSAHWFLEPLTSDSRNWSARSPSGKWQSLGDVPQPSWAWWDAR